MKAIKIITKVSLLLLLINILNSCGIYRPTDAREFPPEPDKRVQKNLDEGRGFRLFNDNDNKSGGVFDFATSNEMWRASLDVLDFVPLISADYGGGVIITDWYNDDNNSNEAVKITIYFLSNEIRSDALNVKTHRKICENNNCKVSELKSEINEEIKLAILKKAALIKKEGLDKIIKEQGEYQVVPTEASK